MVFYTKLSLLDRKEFRPVTECIYHKQSNSKMSASMEGRNLLRLNIAINKRNSRNESVNSECTGECVPKLSCADENRNSVIDAVNLGADVCEVTTTEITERKTRKKTSAIHTIRNLVRATYITSASSDGSKLPTVIGSTNTTTTATTIKQEEIATSPDNMTELKITENKKESKVRKKKNSISTGNKKYRKNRRNRRARGIQNEGAPLWTPTEECFWISAGGRKVQLAEISLNELCDSEKRALKQLAVERLHASGIVSQITIPKEHHAAARRRWKQLLQLGKKGKTDATTASQKPQNPVFCIDLSQVIENDKAVDKAHEIAMAKLDTFDENNKDETKHNEKTVQNDYPNMFNRRNSDPTLERFSFTFGTKEDDEDGLNTSDVMLNALRTIGTLKEEDEEDSLSNKRKSRLIEALTLSSSSASAMCILDRDTEFKPPSPKIPKVMVHTADYIIKYALNTIGIFRTGGSKKRVRQMKEDYDNGYACVITEDSNPNDVAALFKEFLRSLPDPLLTRELYPAFLSTAKQENKDNILETIKKLTWLLPVTNRDTLQVTLQCLRKVADHSQDYVDDEGKTIMGNKMDSLNLATLMAPNILHRCKTYKNPNAYQVDGGLNAEDNKASIEIVHQMIDHNEELFKLNAETHDTILRMLLETDPEIVDYILKKKSTRTSLVEVINGVDEEDIYVHSQSFTGRRPSSAGPRTRFSQEEISFRKSNSFNQGPYRPFIRHRRESTGSRPTSTRSDPPDRNSVRTSAIGTPPLRKRKTSKVFADLGENGLNQDLELNLDGSGSNRDSSSPRDSGVVINSSSPPCFQRTTCRRSIEARDKMKQGIDNLHVSDSATTITPHSSPSLSKQKIIRRTNSRNRDSRDSAYDSGMQGMFSNCTRSASTSIHVNEETHEPLASNYSSCDFEQEYSELPRQNSPKSTVFLTDVLEAPSFVAPKSSSKSQRKISLPVLPRTERIITKNKACSVDGDIFSQDTSSPCSLSPSWNIEQNWRLPEWNINPRESQFPSQETIL